MNKLQKLRDALSVLYRKSKKKLLFHGWHHIVFVAQKAVEFAKPIKADLILVHSAALVHDLNYLAAVNSEPDAGFKLCVRYLSRAGYSPTEIQRIQEIVMQAHTRTRSHKISKEAQALSDADTLFKALPITPVVFSGAYIRENKVDLKSLASKIVAEQNKLMREGIYFYTPLAKKKYLPWARTNLALWNGIATVLKDKQVLAMLKLANVT